MDKEKFSDEKEEISKAIRLKIKELRSLQGGGKVKMLQLTSNKKEILLSLNDFQEGRIGKDTPLFKIGEFVNETIIKRAEEEMIINKEVESLKKSADEYFKMLLNLMETALKGHRDRFIDSLPKTSSKFIDFIQFVAESNEIRPRRNPEEPQKDSSKQNQEDPFQEIEGNLETKEPFEEKREGKESNGENDTSSPQKTNNSRRGSDPQSPNEVNEGSLKEDTNQKSLWEGTKETHRDYSELNSRRLDEANLEFQEKLLDLVSGYSSEKKESLETAKNEIKSRVETLPKNFQWLRETLDHYFTNKSLIDSPREKNSRMFGETFKIESVKMSSSSPISSRGMGLVILKATTNFRSFAVLQEDGSFEIFNQKGMKEFEVCFRKKFSVGSGQADLKLTPGVSVSPLMDKFVISGPFNRTVYHISNDSLNNFRPINVSTKSHLCKAAWLGSNSVISTFSLGEILITKFWSHKQDTSLHFFQASVLSICVQPNSDSIFFCGDSNGRVYCINLEENPMLVWSTFPHVNSVVALSHGKPKSNLIVSGGIDRKMACINSLNGETLCSLSSFFSPVLQVEWEPNNQFILAGTFDELSVIRLKRHKSSLKTFELEIFESLPKERIGEGSQLASFVVFWPGKYVLVGNKNGDLVSVLLSF